jgi:hypothetical protein
MPVPIPHKKKGPVIDEWEKLRLGFELLPTYFNGAPQNIGVILGPPSGGLVDIDLDHTVAVELAPDFLPPTQAVFGRASKPRSHWLFYVDAPLRTKRWKAPGHGTLLEFRCSCPDDDGQLATVQTVFPGSTHESGELIEWDSDGEPAHVAAVELYAACDKLVAAVKAKLGVVEREPARRPLLRPSPANDRARVLDRAAKYLTKLPEAVSGQGGHDATYRAACALVIDFDLSPEEAYPLLAAWNETHCKPQWSERDLRHKLEDANDEPDERGRCLNEEWHRQHVADESEAPRGEFVCGQNPPTKPDPQPDDRPFVSPLSIGQMVQQFPSLKQPLVHGLQRLTEVANLIGAPKIGKSWHLYSLLLSVAAGLPWLERFPCERRRVLLIDNELHPETLALRIPCVATAMALQPGDYEDTLEVIALRGQSYDLPAIVNSIIARIESQTYGLVGLDAWYRALPEGVSENDNAQVMRLYNLIDHACQAQGCAWVNVHHTSKGSQSEKSVTDIGAGAGAQSRAADTHLVMRPHEEEGVFVLEAVVRSFAPVDPLPLRWEFPLWVPAMDVDPTLLKGRLDPKAERQAKEDKQGIDDIINALRRAVGPLSTRKLMAESGIGQDRLEKLAARLRKDGHITIQETGKATLYQLSEGA